MTDNKDLKYTQQFKKEPNIPKTYEQFILEEQQLTPEQQQDLYPDLVYEDISSQKSYGPMGANTTKWCSKCSKNITVSSSSAKYCNDCGTAFGTVVKADDINKQIDQNRKMVVEYGGTYEYYEESGKKPDGSPYVKKGSSYTAPQNN